jgi:aspartyl protease family protein
MAGSGHGALTLERESDGHFYVDARVNGATVHFLVDTGATGIALTRHDARIAGLALDQGRDQVGQGASGAVMGQWVELDRLDVGARSLSNTPAVVLEDGDQSLLGQEVLRGFDIEVHGDEMVLR